jgi:hypothetical protein
MKINEFSSVLIASRLFFLSADYYLHDNKHIKILIRLYGFRYAMAGNYCMIF